MGKTTCTGPPLVVEKPQCNLISRAGDLIGSNEDLLRMILIHIPQKPLTRFKSVSKLWLSLISDPDFSLRWYIKHVGSTSGLFIHRSSDYGFVSLDGERENWFGPNFVFDSIVHSRRHRIEVVNCCNGLVLLNLKVKLNLKSYEVRFGVYNPRTNEWKLIPKFPQINPNFTSCYTNMVYDPWKSPHYKLVSILLLPYHHPYKEILIYSSETESWRKLSAFAHYSLDIIKYEYSYKFMFEAGVYLNGAIHWPSKRSSRSFYFDVDLERCLSMPMPPLQGRQRQRTIRYFGESGGHLHLIDYKDDFALKFDVFEMKNDYTKWFVKYKVDLTPLSSAGSIKRFIMLSLFDKNGEKEVRGDEESAVVHHEEEEESEELMMYIPLNKMVISYNLKDRKSKEVCPLLLSCPEIDDLNAENWSVVHQITY